VDISGNISTVAGTTRGFSGDGGAATSAQLNRPTGVEIDGSGNLYISDNTNNRIRKVDISGNISTVAGTGTGGFSGDGGAATSAQLNRPTDVEIDGSGNLYIADTNNHRIRKVAPPPTVNLSVSATSGTEAATTAITVTATTSAAVTSDETVTLAVSGTGITAGDYTLSGTTLSGTTLTIPSGIATGTATFTVVDDALAEVTETATLTISNPSSGLTLGTTTTQDITITDNDKGVVFSKTTATATEGGATDSYTIKLNTVPTNPVTVTLNTGNQLEDVTALTFNADATALNAQTVTLRGLLNK
jgi:glucose/arabinose dehydrogenase